MAWHGNDELVRILSALVNEEPTIRQALRIVQDHCVSGGLHLLFGDHGVPPTPSFGRHVSYYYTAFCRDAVEAFLTVGFVPYRLRALENGARIPEVLPLGTYGWFVARGDSRSVPRSGLWSFSPSAPSRGGGGRSNNSRGGKEADDNDDSGGEPVLRYQVSSMYCKGPIYVYEFDRPSTMYPCTSALAALVPQYVRLRHKRECTRRADLFHSQPGLVFEHQNRTHVNDVTKSGAGMLSGGGATTPAGGSYYNNHGSEAQDQLSADRRMVAGRQEMYHHVLDDIRDQSHLPQESVTLIAPTNHAVHSLDRVMSPQEMMREELLFMRSIAITIGIPCSLLLQGSGAVASGSTSSGAGAGDWADSAESSNRQMLDLCRRVNTHLELLLTQAYRAIYCTATTSATMGDPRFRIVTMPTLNLEQLSTIFHLRLVDDAVFSRMIEKVWGAPLGERALQAREEQRKAEFVLPFKDKKKDS